MTEQQPGPEGGAPAGWYPHPTMAGTQAYWDGQAWTDHVAPAAAPAPQAQGAGSNTNTAATLVIFVVVIAAIVLVGMALDAMVK